MKTCPFCREDIKEDAIKCRYCGSYLLGAEVQFNSTAKAPLADDRQVNYVVDKGLISFAKFAATILAMFITVGAYLFGFKVDKEAEAVKTAVEETQRLHDNALKISAEIQSARDDTKRTANEITTLLGQVRQNAEEVSSQKEVFIAIMNGGTIASPNKGSLSDRPTTSRPVGRVYTKGEILLLIQVDAVKAATYFKKQGIDVTYPVTVSEIPNLQNAFFDGKKIVFGMGMVNGELFGPYEPSIIYHEAAISLLKLPYNGQSGAIENSVADVMAVVIRGEGWTIGSVKSSTGTRPLRSLENPGSAYDLPVIGKDRQVDHMSKFDSNPEDSGGVHINSGILNKAAYLLSEGGTFHNVNVGRGIGRDNLGLLYIQAIKRLGTQKMNFIQFRDLLIKEASQMYGIDAAGTVKRAFEAVGL